MGRENPTQKIIKIPKSYNAAERAAIGIEIVKHIRKETAKGNNPNGARWSGKAGRYSKSYAKSIDFKNVGKSKNKVTLRLSSDMLAELDVISSKPGEIVVGYADDNREKDKAEGNILGTYGNPSPISGKQRDFLNITDKTVRSAVLSRFPLRDRAKRLSAAARAIVAFKASGQESDIVDDLEDA